jgi:hypothetical protein
MQQVIARREAARLREELGLPAVDVREDDGGVEGEEAVEGEEEKMEEDAGQIVIAV